MSLRSLSALVSVGVLSYKAQETLSHALTLHQESDLIQNAGEFFVYFNAISAGDEVLAQKAGVAFSGAYENMGIHGGFRAIAERARLPYVLILENDIIPLDGADVTPCVNACVADMLKHNIRIFSLRSRGAPGEGAPWSKYLCCFPVRNPIGPHIPRQAAPRLRRLGMRLRHGRLDKFRGRALYVEKAPHIAQPEAIRRLPSGNFLTDSRFQNWSNQALLVERSFFLDVICRRVEQHPDPRLVNGHQDIERAINSWWWRRQREAMGHAAVGVFTHLRLDR